MRGTVVTQEREKAIMDFKPPTDYAVRLKMSLSNGETIYEGREPFVFLPGLKSPLARMLEYADDYEIRSLSLITKEGVEFHLPSSGNNPKFRAFDVEDKPLDYTAFRKIGGDIKGKNGFETFSVIQAIYKDKKIEMWVSEKKPHQGYVVIGS
jgi:hypothetical protein